MQSAGPGCGEKKTGGAGGEEEEREGAATARPMGMLLLPMTPAEHDGGGRPTGPQCHTEAAAGLQLDGSRMAARFY